MVDARSLTVGSHVMHGARMARVESVTNDSLVGLETADGDWREVDPCTDHIEPIGITEELLGEIGFEWSDVSASMWRHYEKGRVSLSEGSHGRWKVYVCGMRHGYPTAELWVRWLHEAEAFVRMACGVELFKD